MIGQHGVTTILNAAPGRADLGPELLDSVDILVVNEDGTVDNITKFPLGPEHNVIPA